MRVLREAPPSVHRARPLVVWVETFVDPNGRIQDCEVMAVFGDARAAKELCRTLKGEEMNPGAGPDGNPVHGVFRTKIAITAAPVEPGFAEAKLPADAVLNVETLPVGAGESLRIGVTVLVDETGAVASCDSGSGEYGNYRQVACQQLSAMTMPIRESKGDAIAYVSPVAVEFTVQAPTTDR
jgi:hypothetical protein